MTGGNLRVAAPDRVLVVDPRDGGGSWDRAAAFPEAPSHLRGLVRVRAPAA